MDPLKILSFGAGAIGTYIGGSLALAGNRVVFVEQPRAAEELRIKGLKLNLGLDPRRAGQAEFALVPPAVEFAASLEEALAYGPFDVAIFALKAYDTAAALEGMKPFIAQLPPILCLQNGVDNEPAIAAVLGKDKVIAGTVTHSVGRRGVGDIILEKLRGVGLADGHPLSKRLVQALDEAFLNGKLYPVAAEMKWSKMLTNLLGGSASAIFDLTVAQIYADPRLYAMEIRMIKETLAVMKAQGLQVVDVPKTPVRLLAWAASHLPAFIARPLMVKFVGGGRGAKMPSFHIDLRASNRGKSEVDYYNGAVVRAGAKLGIPTPVNQLLTETLLDLTAGKLPLDEFAHQPEKFLAKL